MVSDLFIKVKYASPKSINESSDFFIAWSIFPFGLEIGSIGENLCRNGEKVQGFSNLENQITGFAADFIQGNVSAQLSGHDELAVYLLHENMYKAKFYVETPSNKRQIQLKEIY